MRYGKHLSTEAVNRKYAHAMREVYDITKNGGFIRAYDIAKKHNVTSGLMAALTRLKIVDRVKLDEKGINFIWKVSEPNIALANTVRNDINLRTNHVKQDNPKLWDEMVKGVNSLQSTKETTVDMNEVYKIMDVELKLMIKDAVRKALAKPVKTRKVLKWRNPFYWVTK